MPGISEEMEVVLEVNDRNGFEAWRRLVLEMERDTVNRKCFRDRVVEQAGLRS